MIIKTNRKYILHSICLILFSILLLSITASAVVETNTTLLLEDNLVILLDYSGNSVPYREYIQPHVLHSIQNVKNDSNVSIVVYGGFINSTELYPMDSQDNRKHLKEFVLNITGIYGDAAHNNGDEGFEKARKILYNSTGTEQILLISGGVISDGRNNATDRIIKKIKELKNNNIKIQLFQVSTTYLNNSSKDLYKSFKYLSDETNTKAVVLNPEEDIVFFKNETRETLPIGSPMSPVIDDEYLNEFSNDGEKSTLTSRMKYDRGENFFLFHLSKPSKVHFYSYCNQTCIIVPFDIEQRLFFDDKQVMDVFKSKEAIELVKSGNVTESAYIFSIGKDVCDNYGFDVLKEESTNLGTEIVTSILSEKNAKLVKKFIPKPNFIDLTISALCYKVSSDEGEVFNKIAEGRIYTNNLKNEYAWYDIVGDFQSTNLEAMQMIRDVKNSFLSQIHSTEQSLYQIIYKIIELFYTLIKFLFNLLSNPSNSIGIFSEAMKDISDIFNHVERTNMEIFDEKLNLINNNYNQLLQISNKNYENEAKLALNRIKDKENRSSSFIDDATSKFNELDSQILVETILNIFEEPETNYSMARLKRDSAESFLRNAEENHAMYKFNSAIQNSNDSIAQSREGIKFVNIEKSKDRYFKYWVKIFGVIVLILLILIIRSMPRQK